MRTNRRDIFKALGGVGAVLLSGDALAQEAHSHTADIPEAKAPEEATAKRTYGFLNSDEAAFVEAAIARLIPSEPEWAGALDADVSVYIDRQLGGAFGQGAKLYRSGPFLDGSTTQGYQLQFTPAELFQFGIKRLDESLRKDGLPFLERSGDAQDQVLTALENGDIIAPKALAQAFFQLLHGLTMEGYFADPFYGGNKGMASWRMLGFPGAQAGWTSAIEDYGAVFDVTPVSLSEGGHNHHGSERKG